MKVYGRPQRYRHLCRDVWHRSINKNLLTTFANGIYPQRQIGFQIASQLEGGEWRMSDEI